MAMSDPRMNDDGEEDPLPYKMKIDALKGGGETAAEDKTDLSLRVRTSTYADANIHTHVLQTPVPQDQLSPVSPSMDMAMDEDANCSASIGSHCNSGVGVSTSRPSTPVEQSADLVQSPSRRRQKIIVQQPLTNSDSGSGGGSGGAGNSNDPNDIMSQKHHFNQNSHGKKEQMLLYSPRITHLHHHDSSNIDPCIQEEQQYQATKRKGRYRDVFHRYTHRRRPSTPTLASTSTHSSDSTSMSGSMQSPPRSHLKSQSQNHLKLQSQAHAYILPPDGKHLQTPLKRWEYQSKLAGRHSQPMHILDISHTKIPPRALAHGITPLLAQHITDLRYNLNWNVSTTTTSANIRSNCGNIYKRQGDGNGGRGYDLPSFLDLVANLFPNLECLTFLNSDADINIDVRVNLEDEDSTYQEEGRVYSADGEDTDRETGIDPKSSLSLGEAKDKLEDITNSPNHRHKHNSTQKNTLNDRKDSRAHALVPQQTTQQSYERDTNTTIPMKMRMERLYILYRLPDLQRINGIPVTDEERNLARPMSPSGQKVKRHEWIVHSSSTHDKHALSSNCSGITSTTANTRGGRPEAGHSRDADVEEVGVGFDDVEVQLHDSSLEPPLGVHVHVSNIDSCAHTNTDASMSTDVGKGEGMGKNTPVNIILDHPDSSSGQSGADANTSTSTSANASPILKDRDQPLLGMFPRTGKSIAVKGERNNSSPLSQSGLKLERWRTQDCGHDHPQPTADEEDYDEDKRCSKLDLGKNIMVQDQSVTQQHSQQTQQDRVHDLNSSERISDLIPCHKEVKGITPAAPSALMKTRDYAQTQRRNLDTFFQKEKSRGSTMINPIKSVIGSDVAIAGNLISKMTFHDAEKENSLLGDTPLKKNPKQEPECAMVNPKDDSACDNFTSSASLTSSSTNAPAPLLPSPLVGSTIKVKIKKRHKANSLRPPPSPASTFKVPSSVVMRKKKKKKRKNILPNISVLDQMDDEEEEDDNLYHCESMSTRGMEPLPVLKEY